LDRELEALAPGQRQAVILRYLEGRNVEESARIAGCPAGTLGRRASDGLARLQKRLARRDARLGALALLLGMLESEARAATPATLLPSVLAASKLAAAGAAAGAAAQSVVLAEGVMKAMFWMKMRNALAMVAGIVLVIGLIASRSAKNSEPVQSVVRPEHADVQTATQAVPRETKTAETPVASMVEDKPAGWVYKILPCEKTYFFNDIEINDNNERGVVYFDADGRRFVYYWYDVTCWQPPEVTKQLKKGIGGMLDELMKRTPLGTPTSKHPLLIGAMGFDGQNYWYADFKPVRNDFELYTEKSWQAVRVTTWPDWETLASKASEDPAEYDWDRRDFKINYNAYFFIQAHLHASLLALGCRSFDQESLSKALSARKKIKGGMSRKLPANTFVFDTHEGNAQTEITLDSHVPAIVSARYTFPGYRAYGGGSAPPQDIEFVRSPCRTAPDNVLFSWKSLADEQTKVVAKQAKDSSSDEYHEGDCPPVDTDGSPTGTSTTGK
jgi:hypothetical protein